MIHTSPRNTAMSNTPNSQNLPLKVAIRHDLAIELHNDNFSIVRKLTIDEALGLIGMLNYVTREHVHLNEQRAKMAITVAQVQP